MRAKHSTSGQQRQIQEALLPRARSCPACGRCRCGSCSLTLWTLHSGRICVPTTKMTGVMVVLESEAAGEADTACQLAVYNMLPPGPPGQGLDQAVLPCIDTPSRCLLCGLFPEGTRLAVKEPYFKERSQSGIFGDGTAGIRVDCPSDIIFFLEGAASAAISAREGKVADGPAGGGPRSQEGLDAEACTDPEVLRQRGNELYRAGDYAQALRCYERWLQLVPGSGPALANAAAAHLELGQWEQSYTSAREAFCLKPSSVKARYRLARAMLHLRCYGPARDHLTALRQQMPNVKSVADLLRTAESLAAQGGGRFDMAAILKTNTQPAQLADWVGPIEVFASPEAGCGLRTTRAVKAGELLLVEKALAAATSPSNSLELRIDMSSRSMNSGSQQQLAGQLLRLSAASALDRRRILALSAGEQPAGRAQPCAALKPFQTVGSPFQ
ncbi:hypothetical protein ABPG77_004288 [Micractinium sp. CCAP 211/92]